MSKEIYSKKLLNLKMLFSLAYKCLFMEDKNLLQQTDKSIFPIQIECIPKQTVPPPNSHSLLILCLLSGNSLKLDMVS